MLKPSNDIPVWMKKIINEYFAPSKGAAHAAAATNALYNIFNKDQQTHISNQSFESALNASGFLGEKKIKRGSFDQFDGSKIAAESS